MKDNKRIGETMPIKVLAIDDDPALVDLLKIILTTQGFSVITATAGVDGVRLVHEFAPDIIILDLMMPGMNGWDVCSSVREFSSVPILILSALDNPGNVASALDAGADDYLVKPVPTGVLVAHINNLSRRSGLNNHNGKLQQHAAALI
jgi:two-component system response regulator MtrA